MNYKKLKWTATGALASVALGAASAHAQSADALLDKLVQKGVLTAQEAGELRKESDKGPGKPDAAKMGSPEWVKSLKFNGDFRGRYDGVFQDTDPVTAGADRHRLRYRLRFGATVTMSDQFEVGLRLGSGEVGAAAPSLGGSVFSANTTLNNDASRKFIFVDLAYAKWKPVEWGSIEIGKMNNGFWFTDMVMDPDYNPEGAQEKISVTLNQGHTVGLTLGQWVIAETFSGNSTGNNNDAYLFVNQIDWTAKWSGKVSSRAGVAVMSFRNQQDMPAALETFLNQNGTPAVGAGAQSFNPVVGRAEVTYSLDSFPAFQGKFPITAGGEYAWNPSGPNAGSNSKAYNLGVTFGSAKAKGNWQFSYNYKNIGAAAVWHGLNDDDFGFAARGGTDVRGHQVIASYHPYSPLFVNLRYMKTGQINNAPGTFQEQDRLFFDLLWVF